MIAVWETASWDAGSFWVPRHGPEVEGWCITTFHEQSWCRTMRRRESEGRAVSRYRNVHALPLPGARVEATRPGTPTVERIGVILD